MLVIKLGRDNDFTAGLVSSGVGGRDVGENAWALSWLAVEDTWYLRGSEFMAEGVLERCVVLLF